MIYQNQKNLKDKKSYPVSIGQFGKILNILKENQCKKSYLQEK